MCDPISVQRWKDDEYAQDFYKTKKSLWTNTDKLSSYLGRAQEFDVIFVVGGFGRKCFSHLIHSLDRDTHTNSIAMWDLATDKTSIQLIEEFHQADKILVGLCHGSAAFLEVKLADGTPLLTGQAVTGFSGLEEEQAYANHIAPPNMPFDLEKALNDKSGGKYEKSGEAWAPHVVVSPSKKLLFGQNPDSAHPLAVELLKVLQGTS